MTKLFKKSRIEFDTLVHMILVLIVIIVVISIFYILINKPTLFLKDTADETQKQGEGIFDIITNVFGKCNPSEKKCLGNNIQICNQEGKWETQHDECPSGCEDGNCI